MDKTNAIMNVTRGEDRNSPVFISFVKYDISGEIGVGQVSVFYEGGDPGAISEIELEDLVDHYLGWYMGDQYAGCRIVKIEKEKKEIVVKLL